MKKRLKMILLYNACIFEHNSSRVFSYVLLLLSNTIIVFRAGEQGRFWYAVLGGSLEVRYHAPDTENKV